MPEHFREIVILLLSIALITSGFLIIEKNGTLKNKNDEISRMKHSVQITEAKLNNTTENLNRLEAKYNRTVDNLQKNITTLENSIQTVNETKIKYKNKLERKYTFHLPTSREVKKIVRETDIDEREWSEDFDCTEFSYRLISELKERGVSSCGVEINFEDGSGHILVAVNTTEGIRYVEPQDDIIFKEIEIGNDYCNLVDWSCEEPWKITKISSCYGILKV